MDALLASWFAGLCPPNTAGTFVPVAERPAFDPAEEAAIRNAVSRRRDEFRSGRECARRALADLGCPPQGIPADARRVPMWPSGFVGSISHGAGLCIALVARAADFIGVGVDVEAADAVATDLVDIIASPGEWAALRRGGPDDRIAATVCFSAKETFYKAYSPSTGVLLGFREVRLEVDWYRHRFNVTLCSADRPSLGGCRSWNGHFLLARPALATAILIDKASPCRDGRRAATRPIGRAGTPATSFVTTARSARP